MINSSTRLVYVSDPTKKHSPESRPFSSIALSTFLSINDCEYSNMEKKSTYDHLEMTLTSYELYTSEIHREN